jgi:hypothetical protein
MLRFYVLVIFALSCSSFVFFPALVIPIQAQEVSKDVLIKIRSCSVSISWEGKVIGSGTVFKKNDEIWVLTAKHVVSPGDWRNAGLTVLQRKENEKVVGVVVDKVILDEKEDVAFLRVCSTIFSNTTEFHIGKTPGLDTPVIHCGSMARQHHTITRGWIVGINRPDPFDAERIRDQVNLAAQGGSSGGGVFLAENGHYVGMVVSGSPPSVVFFVPMRCIEIK